MKKNQKTIRKVGALLLAAGLLLATGCGQASDDTDSSSQVATDVVASGVELSADVKTKDVDMETAVTIACNGDSAQVTSIGSQAVSVTLTEQEQDGLSLADGILRITQAGVYILQGELNGQVQIEVSKDEDVQLVLAGVTISCDDSSAIYGIQSDRIYITLQEGTVNTVSDGTTYVYASTEEDEPNATIFSKDDLTFDGTGTLIVNGNYADGIRSKDDLALVDGTYEITAVSDGLQGKDSVTILAGNYMLDVQGDAIKSSNDQEDDKGNVLIEGGTFYITAGDDAVHAEKNLVINDCNMEIAACYEGLEGLTVTINGGTISLVASDDGINAAGGSDTNEFFFGGGMDGGTESAVITINGGELFIDADGDGIDSNGYLYVNGGTVYVEGPENGGNGGLDYALSASVAGGTVLVTGASTMAQGFGSDSTQCSFLYNMTTWAAAGDTIVITDAEGKELLSYTPSKSYNSIVVSMPELTQGETYIVTCGEQTYSVELTSIATSNGQGGLGGGFGGGGQGGFGGRGQNQDSQTGQGSFGGRGQGGNGTQGTEDGTMTPPDGTDMPEMPEGMEGMTPPDGMEIPQGVEGMTPPDGTEMPTPPDGMEMPESGVSTQ